MKFKKYFLFIILLSQIISCDEQITNPNIGELNSYFPLKKGNTWYFSSTYSASSYDTVRVIDQLNYDNNEYFVLSFVLQADTINVVDNVVYINRNKIKTKWLDFNKSNAQTYNFDSKVVTVKRNLTVSSKLGEFDNCICFIFDNPKYADDEKAYYFCEGVGFVKISTAWVDLELVDYILN